MKNKQTLAGYLREHIQEIEYQKHIGIKQEALLKTIQDAGYPNTTLQTLRVLLHRARKSKPNENAATTQPIQQNKSQKKEETNLKQSTQETRSFNYTGSSNAKLEDLF